MTLSERALGEEIGAEVLRVFHAIGRRVKTRCPAPVAHLMGYANGYIGYFPEQAAFAEGGYEPAVSHLDPVAEQTYMREIIGVLREFH